MKKRCALLLLTVSTLLAGCFPVFFAGAAVGGAIVYDQRTVGVIKDDHAIGYQIGTDIQKQKEGIFEDSNIAVVSFNYVVLLVGQAPTNAAKQEAERIALKTPKVKRVFNQITIGKAVSIKQRSKDTWIATAVKTKMLTQSHLKSGQIKVVVEDGTVFLMGTVNKRQADLAVSVARSIKGVKRVVKILEITEVINDD